MSDSPYKRKKDPENVRLALLESAAAIISEKGVAGLTLADVASAAGVTKGGLFHHFENKNTLIMAMFAYLLEMLDADIESYLSKDKEPYGSFTRAYVQASLSSTQSGGKIWSSLLQLHSETELGQRWDVWFKGRLKRHAKTDSDIKLEIVRLAADGAWFALCGDQPPHFDLNKVKRQLVEMTKK